MSKIKIPVASFKAAVFDMDGTMINNMGHHKIAWQKFLKAHGVSVSDSEFKDKVSGKKNNQIFEIFFGNKLGESEIEAYAEEKEAIYRKLYAKDIKEVKGLKKLTNKLQTRNIKIAIATTAIEKNRNFALEQLGLNGKFAVIIGDEHVTHGKPDPEIYLHTARRLKLNPKECIAFEDSPPGVAAAKSAGMTVIGVLTTHSPAELKDADYLINDFSEVTLL